MAQEVTTVTFSMTEVPHFTRLVAFLEDAGDLAHVNADEELEALVDRCRTDLLALLDGDS